MKGDAAANNIPAHIQGLWKAQAPPVITNAKENENTMFVLTELDSGKNLDK